MYGSLNFIIYLRYKGSSQYDDYNDGYIDHYGYHYTKSSPP